MRIHVVVLVAVLAALLAKEVSANSASQSDWSGGTVPPGPVLTWGEEFCESMWMNWMEPGELSVGSDTLFFDSFDRFCPTNWGTPDIGGTYTYEYPDNSLQINNLSSGTYLCRMQASGYHDCRRFVVLGE